MEDYQLRVIEELEALELKLHALHKFLMSPNLFELSLGEQTRLIDQNGYMTGYVTTLQARVKAFR